MEPYFLLSLFSFSHTIAQESRFIQSNIMTMVRLNRIAFAGVAVLGDRCGCSAFCRTHQPIPISFVQNLGTNDVSNRRASSPLPLLLCSGRYTSYANYGVSNIKRTFATRRWSTSTVDRDEEVLEIAGTTYESGDEEEDSDSDEQEVDDDDATEEEEDSPVSLLLGALSKSVQSALKNLSKKTTSLQRELDKAKSLEETINRANLIVSNLYQLPPGTTSAEVEDWENGEFLVNMY